MSVLKLAKKYIVDSQIYVSLMGTALALFFLMHQKPFRLPVLYLIFITYFCGYIYTKFQNQKKTFWKIVIFNAITAGICISIMLMHHNYPALKKWGIIVMLGLFYNSSFLKNHIRNIPLLKIFYVALVWGLMNAFLGFPDFRWSIFFITFFFVIAIIPMFDIRDMYEDKIVTFPRLIGAQNTKYLSYFNLFISTLIASYFLEYQNAIAYFMTCIVAFFLVYYTKNTRNDAYFSFWLESTCVMPILFWLIVNYLA